MNGDPKPYDWHHIQFHLGVPAGTELPLEDFGREFISWLAGPDEKLIDTLLVNGVQWTTNRQDRRMARKVEEVSVATDTPTDPYLREPWT